jgi:hypothetical protein
VAEQRHISDLNPHISPSHWYDSRGQLSIVEHSSRPLIVTHFGSVWLPCAKFKITVGNSPDPKGGTGSPSDDEADPAVEVALLAMVTSGPAAFPSTRVFFSRSVATRTRTKSRVEY